MQLESREIDRSLRAPSSLWSIAIATIVVAGLVLTASPCRASTLVYFEADGGAGNPRGLYNFDTSTGISTLRAAVGGTDTFFAMAARPTDGTVFAVGGTGNENLYTIDINSGVFNLVGSLGTTDITNIAFDPTTSVLYGLGRNTQQFYSIDQTTGARTAIGMTTATRAGLDFSPSGVLYGTTVSGILYDVNPATAADTLVGGSGSSSQLIEDAAFTPTGDMFVTNFHGSIYQVNTLNGALTLVGSTGMGDGLVGLVAEPVPEPGTVVLLGFGVAAILVSLRLRGRSRAV